MSQLNVLYYSCPFDLSGYGTVARNHLVELNKMKSLKLRLRTKKFWQGTSPDLREDGDTLHAMEVNPISNEDFIFIQHLTPENFYIETGAKYHICYTPFETDSLPRSWLLPLRGMDEIWVPSKHNKEAYIKGGLGKKTINVFPHGINTARFNPSVKPMIYPRGSFNVGSVFDWTERKNPTALIRAYYNAFHSGEDVTLSIRSFWRFPVEKTREYIQSEVSRIKEWYGDRKDFPKIQFWFDTMDESLMPSFYRSFDCFVLPTRGEGFGLPLMESMACGVPTIGPSWGGNTEFMNKNNSILVGGKVVPIDNQNFLRYQPQYAGQRWFDISEEELSEKIRWVYDNRGAAMELANIGATDVATNWTWSKTASAICKRLLEIDSDIGAK